MEKYILIKEQSTFYDGHGCGDDGKSLVYVEKTDKYNDKDLTGVKSYTDYDDYSEYDEDDEEYENDEEDDEPDYSAEDGYNCEITSYSYKEITEEQFKEYSEIIEKYNSLFF